MTLRCETILSRSLKKDQITLHDCLKSNKHIVYKFFKNLLYIDIQPLYAAQFLVIKNTRMSLCNEQNLLPSRIYYVKCNFSIFFLK